LSTDLVVSLFSQIGIAAVQQKKADRAIERERERERDEERGREGESGLSDRTETEADSE